METNLNAIHSERIGETVEVNGYEIGPKANLEGAELVDKNLFLANLAEGTLRGVDLNLSNLTGANVYLADCTRANSRLTELETVNFGCETLVEIDLSDTGVTSTNFSKANLRNATLRLDQFVSIGIPLLGDDGRGF